MKKTEGFDAIVWGHRCDGLPKREIARQMGVSPSTIYRSIRREARRRYFPNPKIDDHTRSRDEPPTSIAGYHPESLWRLQQPW